MAAAVRALKRIGHKIATVAEEAIHPPLGGVTDLESYMQRYGAALGQAAMDALKPLHVPGRDEPLDFAECKRLPFPAQQHVITAVAKHLMRDSAAIVSGQCGTGKTLCMMLMAHKHAQMTGNLIYTGLVMCPGQLPDKWERELRETIPGIDVVQIRTWRDAAGLSERRPRKPTWYIVPRDRAKLNPGWKAVYFRRYDYEGACNELKAERKRGEHPNVREVLESHGTLCCRACGEQITEDKTEDGRKVSTPITLDKLLRNRRWCSNERCGEPLWQWIPQPRRWAPAQFIKDHLHGRFDYFVADELHQFKGSSLQGDAMGKLATACEYFIGGTGTLIGGEAEHIRLILWRTNPKSLLADGFAWEESMPFSEKYGRIETVIRETESKSDDFKFGKGKPNRNVTRHKRPGIMPTLFGRHLIDKTVFLSLDDVAEGLPPFEEILVPVEMDAETKAAYEKIEKALAEHIKPMVAKGDRRLLGRMLSVLLGYPDHPHGFGSIGYMDGDKYVHVIDCPDLDQKKVRPKERALLDMLEREHASGRQVWTYCQMTDKRDVMARLADMAGGKWLRSKILRSKEVDLPDREAWIAKHGPLNDCMFSHPQLVETGLDLFDKKGGHNFSSLAFYQQGYQPFIMRQAAARAWRIGQRLPCRVYYYYYVGTMQERCMSLMGKKFAASIALEGKFSTEGLAAMAGEDSGMEMALAKSLSEKLSDDLDAAAHWQKISIHHQPTQPPAANQVDTYPLHGGGSHQDGDSAFLVQPCLLPPATRLPSQPTKRAGKDKPKPLYRQRVLSLFD